MIFFSAIVGATQQENDTGGGATERHSMYVSECVRETYWRIANETVACLGQREMCVEINFGELESMYEYS